MNYKRLAIFVSVAFIAIIAILFYTTFKTPEVDFSISITPTSNLAWKGNELTFTVDVSSTSSQSYDVLLLHHEGPSGLTYSFNPEVGSPPFTSTLKLKVGENAPPGDYTVTIIGEKVQKIKTGLKVLGATAYSSFNLTIREWTPPEGAPPGPPPPPIQEK